MDHQERSDTLRSRIRSFLRFSVPNFDNTPVVHETVHEDGFTRKLISYPSNRGDSIQAFLLEPETVPAGPAVVALHQHNSEWRLGKSEIAGLAGDPFQAFGPHLARAGFIVLAPDAIGFESRQGFLGHGDELAPRDTTSNDWLQYYNHAMHRLVHDEWLITEILEDISLSVEAAQKLTGVDRVGMLGHSFGGNLALFSAALDERVSFTCSSGAACSFQRKRVDGTGLEMALVIPGFATQFDLDDLMQCIAPRKLFLVSSTNDPFTADADELVERAQPTFHTLGAGDNLQHLRVEGAHSLDRQRFTAIVQWLLTQHNAPIATT